MLLDALAFGLAGSQVAGTFAAWGASSVKFHQFRGALSGLMAALLAALLAQEDFVATREFLDAADGGFDTSRCGVDRRAGHRCAGYQGGSDIDRALMEVLWAGEQQNITQDG